MVGEFLMKEGNLWNKNEKSGFSFCIPLGLHSFAFGEDRLHLGNKNEKSDFSFCIPLGLHYLCKLLYINYATDTFNLQYPH